MNRHGSEKTLKKWLERSKEGGGGDNDTQVRHVRAEQVTNKEQAETQEEA